MDAALCSLVSSLLLLGFASATAMGDPAWPFVVVGYLPEYHLDQVDPDVTENLTDLVAFSIEPAEDGSLDARRLAPPVLKRYQDLCARHPCRLLVTIGGWGRCAAFGKVTVNDPLRSRFVQQLLAFCRDSKVDGVDFDWEFPKDEAEKAGYAKLLADTHRAFAAAGLKVTVAMAAWQDLGAAAYDAVDRIHLMSYDHDGPQHASVEQAKADVETLLARHVAKQKICLGLPFYGRDQKTKTEVSYADIVSHSHPSPDTDQIADVSFNGPTTIRRKTTYARETGVAGVMIWDLGQDVRGDGSLIGAVRGASN